MAGCNNKNYNKKCVALESVETPVVNCVHWFHRVQSSCAIALKSFSQTSDVFAQKMVAHFRMRQKFTERIKFLPRRKFLPQLDELPAVVSVSYQKFFSVVRKIKFALLFDVRLKLVYGHAIHSMQKTNFCKDEMTRSDTQARVFSPRENGVLWRTCRSWTYFQWWTASPSNEHYRVIVTLIFVLSPLSFNFLKWLTRISRERWL